MDAKLRIGTAGWSIPRPLADRFPPAGSGLARYAGLLPAVEINSSFYRPHRPATYERWAAATPEGFAFSVKAPKAITHERRLKDADDLLAAFLAEIAALGPKRGPVLLQLPPSLTFDAQARAFIDGWRDRYDGATTCEPRHASWFTPEAEAHLVEARIARVAADPAVVPIAAAPGGWPGLNYVRLHGAPRMYSSAYSAAQIARVGAMLGARAPGTEAWCIFDNTVHGAAAANALELLADSRV